MVKNPAADIKKTDCDPTADAAPGQYFKDKISQVGDDPAIRYSCVLYDRQPESLIIDPSQINQPEILPIEDAGISIDTLTFEWSKTDGADKFDGCQAPGDLAELPKIHPENCAAGMLRVELIDSQANNRQEMLERSFLAYFKPAPPGSGAPSEIFRSSASGADNQGALVAGNCDDNTNRCRVVIKNVNAEKLYLNLRSIYLPNRVIITGTTSPQPDQPSRPVKFREAQMEVDSTGRANDILKRVSVRLPLSGIVAGVLPSFVLQTSDELCKQLQLRPNTASNQVDDLCPAVTP